METNVVAQTVNNQVAQNLDNSAEEFRIKMQNFTKKLNQAPPAESIDRTADGNASTVLISHIEMTLDEYFFGMWSMENFKWAVITNEIVASIDLIVIHPVTGTPIKRVGAAAIQIQVDKVPDDIKGDSKKRNQWANDTANKKPNALDMGFPKLKAECLKNAANSLGELFGRSLNRKKKDTYNPIIKPKWQDPEANNNQNAA